MFNVELCARLFYHCSSWVAHSNELHCSQSELNGLWVVSKFMLKLSCLGHIAWSHFHWTNWTCWCMTVLISCKLFWPAYSWTNMEFDVQFNAIPYLTSRSANLYWPIIGSLKRLMGKNAVRFLYLKSPGFELKINILKYNTLLGYFSYCIKIPGLCWPDRIRDEWNEQNKSIM